MNGEVIGGWSITTSKKGSTREPHWIAQLHRWDGDRKVVVRCEHKHDNRDAALWCARTAAARTIAG